jgi:thiamine kinase-like enzyme
VTPRAEDSAATHTLAPLDPDNARAALASACAVAGLDAGDAELVRLGSNAVFRLRRQPVVGRVMRSAERLFDARREVAVSRWLERCGVPAVRALDVDQPLVSEGRVVTFWESVSERAQYGTTAELATILRQLHAQATPAEVALPQFDPFARAQQRISDVRTFASDDRSFMEYRADELQSAYSALSFVLPSGPIHGDANVGNLLRGRNGEPFLGDLDGFAVGPREWDLVLTAMYFGRYGWHSESEYREFCDGYGYDVMTWPGYVVLADVREFLMVTWLAQNAVVGSNAWRELARRLKTLRTGHGRDAWQPF